MKQSNRITLGVVMVMAGLAMSARAELRLPKVFSDHMVLQRDCAASVWGWGEPGDTITVTVGGQKKSSIAGGDGCWRVTLDPLSASTESRDLTVSGKSTNLVVRDVLVGDVWLCAGQSNMEMAMNGVDNASVVLPAATNRMIRLLAVKAPAAGTPVDDIPSTWMLSTPMTVAPFSAVGYFFGRKLQEETGIPIGLINNAWGGTQIERWIPAEAPRGYPELTALATQMAGATATYNIVLGKMIDRVDQWVVQARAARAKGAVLPAPPALPEHPAVGGLSGIYNGRVAPLTPFAIKGAIWYQGESNGGDDDIYYSKMRCMIGSWRAAWNRGDFPFYYVLLANFQAPSTIPAGGDGWAKIRMAQIKSLTIPNTGMASALDIGAANDIHPKNKEDVGTRLALWALNRDYGKKDVVCSGPIYKGMTIEGSKVRVSFDYAGSGLMVGKKTGHGAAKAAQGEALHRFAVASTNQVWFWADAVVDGSTVVVSSTNVPAPTAVRYAYSMNPDGCNLYNKEGLPAAPFRSDNW